MPNTAKLLRDVMSRAQEWPEADQAELIELAREIETRRTAGYAADAAELAGIDRGLRAAAEGRFAAAEDVEAVFRKHRDQ